MSDRTAKAVVVGIILGFISGFFLGYAAYLALFFLLFAGALSPLIVYRMAEPSVIWVSVVPNVIMVPIAVLVEWTKPYHDRPFPWLVIPIGMICMALFSLLAVTPSYLVRNRPAKKEKRHAVGKDTLKTRHNNSLNRPRN